MIALLLLLLSALPAPVAADLTRTPTAAQGGYSYYLVGIDVSGVQRLNRQQVTALSGLKTGRTVRVADFEAARTRLVETGLFTSVGYRVRTTGGGYSVIVTFTVVEPAWQARVFFDNFVGYSDAQLTQAVAASVPTFDGSVPEQQAALDRVKAALQKFLVQAGTPGTISYLLVDDKLLGLRRYRFRVDWEGGGKVRMCAVVVDSRASAHDEMTARTASLVGGDYSRDFITRFAAQNLLPIAGRDGYLKARVGEIRAVRASAPESCDGVSVTLAIDEGLQYAWGSIRWTGNAALPSTDLDRLLALAVGERADRTRLDRSIRAVIDAYRNMGYLDALVRPVFTFDDAKGQAAATMEIREGPQFRMGSIQIAGLEAQVADAVTGLWQLAAGVPFDPSYAARFAGEARMKMRDALAAYKAVDLKLNRNPQAATIDVVLTFRTARERLP